MENFPEGKFLTTVKIGPKGQIVIPKEVRDMFSLNAGDSLVLMADKGQGIALQPFSYILCYTPTLKTTLKKLFSGI
jgi:AbrB family looped-hinge helix DNA binding protein